MTTWPIPPADLAREIILGRTQDISGMSIGEFVEGKIKPGSLTDDEFDAYRDEVEQLIDDSAVTVTLPGDPVCAGCGGTGQPGENDGTPKDLPQHEAVDALLEEHRWSDLSHGDLAEKILALFGGEAK